MISNIYKNIILKNPKTILIFIILTALFFGYNSKDFRLDASSETLLIEGDPDLKYLQEISEKFGSKDFLVLTLTHLPFGDTSQIESPTLDFLHLPVLAFKAHGPL